jgi:hypothetical protein
MMLKRTLLNAVLLASLGTLAVPPTWAAVGVTINIGPPPMRYEAVPAARAGYVWRPGYWNWNRNRHVWVGGVWMRSRQGYVYAQPNWVNNGNQWQLRQGAWARGDLDRDGVPNRGDNDRDGDGVRNKFDPAPNNPRR